MQKLQLFTLEALYPKIDKLKEKIEAWETKNVGGYQKIFPTDVLFIYV